MMITKYSNTVGPYVGTILLIIIYRLQQLFNWGFNGYLQLESITAELR